ncbi:MAG TPA: N-6 DNA methylase, partial [Bacteroidia bacterium]|nr:N-6 DNA methylase [Bacteroidia bacterium]
EPYGNLKHAIHQGDFYKNLFHLFEQADEKYNSGIFDFTKDKISKHLSVDNKVIKTIINELYYPESPYEFSVLSVEILGSAYEQFLGKQIKIDTAHRAKIEEKPEVRKAGGVYYTPQYIVEYIVKNTVGKLIEGKIPKEISKLHIVDPACGSGSFLLGAYQFLLDFHKNYYSNNGKPSKGKKDNPLTPEGNLTTAEKKRILLNNIFGVDIDVNAVEVTKLSLLLKCMEGETEASINTQTKLWNERVLPSLDDNIKSGNSLIDTDYYDSQLDFGDEKKIKPFNWEKAFPETFKKGGFDIVIGNPPYGALFNENETNYFKTHYKTSVWRGESYLLFVDKALSLLLKNGLLGFIIPDSILNLGFTQPLRELLLQNSSLQEIVSLPSNVFSSATVDTVLLFTVKKETVSTFHSVSVSVKFFSKKSSINIIENPTRSFNAETKEWYSQKSFNLQSDSSEQSLIQKLDLCKKRINDISEMFSGIKTYEVGKGNPAQTEKVRDTKPFTSEIKKDKDWMPFYDGKHIGRYQLLWKDNNWIDYGTWLAAPRNPANFSGEKILIRKIIGESLIATYIPETSYCNTLLFVLKLTDKSYSYKSILGILNSALIAWYFRKKFQISNDDTFPQIMIRDILQFPIPEISSHYSRELEKNVDLLLKLNAELPEVKLQTKTEQIQSKIEYCEQKINEAVYRLYELTEDEIKIVEGK